MNLEKWREYVLLGGFVIKLFYYTRSCAALRAADLDWIVGPEYSLGGYIFGEQGRKKQKRYWSGVTNDLGGGQGRNKQKRYQRGVTTDLLDV